MNEKDFEPIILKEIKLLGGKEFNMATRVCFALMIHGWEEKQKVLELSGCSEEKLNDYYENLRESHFFGKDGFIELDENYDTSPRLCVCLMVCACEGKLRRGTKKEFEKQRVVK